MKVAFPLFCVFTILTALSSNRASAAEFNPHFIISDAELQDYQSMTRTDISAFLKEKNSYLSTYRAIDEDGKKRRAADIIYRAARESKINPKYLLVKLQKEQSLITAKQPNQKQLDWATGYGVCDSCSFSDPKVLKHKGFSTQVQSAAGIMRWYYDNYPIASYIKKTNATYSIDGQQITPTTLATAFLYTYTPHINGNKNFWLLWENWFGYIYPENSLVKTASDPTVYLLQNNKKRAFKNFTSLATRFDPKSIITIPEGELARYATGTPLTLPNYSILFSGDTYYLLDFDSIRPFDSQKTVQALGFNPQEILEVSADEISGYTLGNIITNDALALLGRIVRVRETKELYYLKDNSAYTIIDKIIAKINIPDGSIKTISAKNLEQYEQIGNWKLHDATLFKTINSSTIFVVEKSKKRPIANEDTFNYLGYNIDNVYTVPAIVSDIHETGLPLDIETPVEMEQQTPGAEGTSIIANTHTDSYSAKSTSTILKAYVVMDAKTGEILSAKNKDEQLPIASLVKVVTAAVALEDAYTPNQLITYDPQKHDDPIYHSFRLVAGEKIRAKNAMDAMLVSSINTAAHIVAQNASNNENGFIEQMNAYAKKLSLKNSIFTDVSGTEDSSISTAEEYATIFLNSTKNKTLLALLGKKSYKYTEVLDLDEKPDHADVNTNELLRKTNLPFIIRASKTGYLPDSGANLAMLIERKTDKKKFVIVTLGNPNAEKRFDDPEAIARWAVETF